MALLLYLLGVSSLLILHQGSYLCDGLRVIADPEHTAIIGEDTSLYCSYRDEPQGAGFNILIDWAKNVSDAADGWQVIASGVSGDTMMPPSTSDPTKYNATQQYLYIFNVNGEDSGTYKCTMKMSTDNIPQVEGTATMELKVEAKSESTSPPTVKDNLAVPVTSNISLLFVLSCIVLILLS
ncbi:uncharacterized protein LOC144440139 [Glandiceps talaboti]